MLPIGATYDESEANRQRLDSIRNAIVNEGADFGEMAVKVFIGPLRTAQQWLNGLYQPQPLPLSV